MIWKVENTKVWVEVCQWHKEMRMKVVLFFLFLFFKSLTNSHQKASVMKEALNNEIG